MERLVRWLKRFEARVEKLPHIVAWPVCAVVVAVLFLAMTPKQWEYLRKRV